MTAVPAAARGLDPRTPLVRLVRLLDGGRATALHPADDSGVMAVAGRIGGGAVIAYCTDATAAGGALGAAGADRIIDAIRVAHKRGCPVVGLWHSGGARLADGVESLDGMGRMFTAMTRASGRVPQISVILGPAAGAAAYGPALTDVVVLSDQARVFVTGPDVVRSVTGEVVDMEGLGGPDVHRRRSGVAHLTAASEDDAYRATRQVTGLLATPGVFDLGRVGPETDLRALVPAAPRQTYDVRPVLASILDPDPDGPGFVELQADWARNVVVGLGRMCGRTIGVVANNPMRRGGCLDALAADKAARFVRMCDAFGVPLAVLVDVPGFLPGVDQEWDGVVRRGAKLLHAFAAAVVPRATVITRKSYGGAHIAMNSRSLGATAVFAWPDAEIAVMGPEAAVEILHRKAIARAPDGERADLRTRLVQRQRRDAGGVERAVALEVVDEVIAPAATRRRLAGALSAAPDRRGRHSNLPL